MATFVNEHNYTELEAAATRYGATQEEINALGEWFSKFGQGYWNGECYCVDEMKDIHLYPMHRQIDEDEYEIIGYSFSSRDLWVD